MVIFPKEGRTPQWIKVDRDQSKIITKCKTILQDLFRQRAQGRNYDISAGQHQPSSGLLRKTRIYMVFMFSIFTGDTLLTEMPAELPSTDQIFTETSHSVTGSVPRDRSSERKNNGRVLSLCLKTTLLQ